MTAVPTYHNRPFTAGEILERFNELAPVFAGKSSPYEGIKFSASCWFTRILSPNTASKPVGRDQDEFLHHHMVWQRRPEDSFQQLVEGGSSANHFQHANVIRHWMSHFGFYKYQGELYQVHPADMFAYYFDQEFPFSAVMKRARHLTIENADGDWVYLTFCYYIRSFLQIGGQGHDVKKFNQSVEVYKPATDESALQGRKFVEQTFPSTQFRTHWLMKEAENLKFTADRKITTEKFITLLPTLGSYKLMGWSPTLDAALSNKVERLDRVPTLEEVNDRAKEHFGPDFQVFRRGYWHERFMCPGADTIKALPLSQQKVALKKLLGTYSNKLKSKDNIGLIQLDKVRKDLFKEVIYTQETLGKKSFFKSVFLPEAEELGYEVSIERYREFDGTRPSGLRVSQKRYSK